MQPRGHAATRIDPGPARRHLWYVETRDVNCGELRSDMWSNLHRKPLPETAIMQTASGVFPDGRFRPLVDAALRPEMAVEAWDAYRQHLGPYVPNDGETRLYPLVAANLKASGVSVAHPALLVAQRRALALSTVCLHAAEQVNDLFARHGISVVFTKGLALQITEYRNPVLRTFSDIDCCIHVDDIAAVVQLAADQGWHNQMNLIPETSHVVEAHAEMTFRLPSGVALDIHWIPRRAFAYQPALIKQFFDSTEVVAWRGQTWRVPCATWRLIETIEHGVEANQIVPVRWMPDAVRVLENPANEIDWNAIETVARTARLRLVFLAGLTRLAELTDRVSRADLVRFNGRATPLEAVELRARLSPRPTLLHRLKREVLHYALRAPGSFVMRAIRLPAFLVQGAGRSPRAIDFLARLWRHRDAK